MKAMFGTLCFFFLLPFGLIAQGWERVYERAHSQAMVAADYNGDGDIQMIGIDFSDLPDLDKLGYHIKTDLNGVPLLVAVDSIGPKTVWNGIVTQENAILTLGVTQDSTASNVYLRKLSGSGNLHWYYEFPANNYRRMYGLCEAPDGHYIVAGQTYLPDPSGGTDRINEPFIKKIDKADGSEIFEKTFATISSPENAGYQSSKIINTSDGGYLLAYYSLDFTNIDSKVLTIKVDAMGNESWRRIYDFTYVIDMLETANGEFILVGNKNETLVPGDNNILAMRIDALGIIVWTKIYDTPIGGEGRSIIATTNGNYFLSGYAQMASDQPSDIALIKINDAGEEIWFKTYGRNYYDSSTKCLSASDGGVYIAGISADLNGNGNYYLIKTDSNGISLSNEVLGTVYWDEVDNCLPDTDEPGLDNWIVYLAGNNGDRHATTNDFGSYSLPAQEGDYTLSAIPPSPYWEPCVGAYPIQFNANNFDIETIDIPIQASTDCPYLEISIGTNALRPCFASTYAVHYCNWGTVTAEDAYAELEFDPLIAVDSASIPFTGSNGIYTFDLGDVAIGECANFNVSVFLDCDANIRTTHCVEAHIFPDSLCNVNSDWSGASIEVDATCTDGAITFNIQNVGTAATTVPINYFVVEDDVILLQGTINQMAASAIETLPAIPGEGATYRLETDQEPNHPGFNMPSVAIEGCTDMPPFNTGFVNIFPQNDANPFIDIDCIVATGSYDPNDKQGFPVGIGDDHIIEKNQDIEYQLRFQNVGTDTAFNIVILDTISPLLNVNSIRPGAASHPYEFRLSGQGIVEFKFNNILLPDSSANELASNGFVKFRIKQKADLPLTTVIENSAAIYFDFNDPVITNTTVHTIGTYRPESTGIKESLAPTVNLQVSPNPFGESTVFELKNYEWQGPLQLYIYDALGHLQRIETISQKRFEFQRKNLAKGIYFFQLKKQGLVLSSGKLVTTADL